MFNEVTPIQINGLSDIAVIGEIYPFLGYYAIKNDGSLWVWGFTARLLDPISNSIYPRRFDGINNVAKFQSDGASHYILKNDGSVWAWGSNSNGVLGVGTTNDLLSPTQVVGLADIKDIVMGHNSLFALKSDGTVWAWGHNELSQLGDGTTTNRSIPIQVNELTDTIDISVLIAYDLHYTLALKNDGTVWEWGINTLDFADLFLNGTVINNSIPVQVVGLNQITDIKVTPNSYYALKTDGTVWTWGVLEFRDEFELSAIPVQVPGLNGITDIVAESNSARLALKNDGTVWAWGPDNNSELGNSPVQVMSP